MCNNKCDFCFLQGFNNIQLTRKFSSADPNYHFGFDPIYLQENNNDMYVDDFSMDVYNKCMIW